MVNTSSAASTHGVSFFGPGLDFATFKDSPHRGKYNIAQLYGQSKLVRLTIASSDRFSTLTLSNHKGNIVYTQELARRHGDQIVTTAVHPG